MWQSHRSSTRRAGDGGCFFLYRAVSARIFRRFQHEQYPHFQRRFQALEQELDRLKKERPHVIQAIKEAREEGDLKENAGYDAARERQGMLEARIKYIESRMALFNVIDLSTLSSEKPSSARP